MSLGRHAWRAIAAAAGVAALTLLVHVISLNGTTIALAYLLYVLIVASTLGFMEALVSSLLATLNLNFFFLPPVGTFTITDPENWVALFSFLATSLIASRLSTEARKQATDALDRQRDVERLYTFSRSILLIDISSDPFPKQLANKLADIFGISAVALFDRRTDTIYRAGPDDFAGSEEQLREAARKDSVFVDSKNGSVTTTVRLGSEPIASLGLQGAAMPDSTLQGIGNLVAIGLERAKAQDMAHQIEAAQQSERLRTTLLDAMAHEFKTPLTSIKAATTALMANPDQVSATRLELIKIADEEAERLRQIIDNTIDMARLDTARIDVQLEAANIVELACEVVASMQSEIEGKRVDIPAGESFATVPVDRRLLKLALKQLLDNALKYSPPRQPVSIGVQQDGDTLVLSVTDHGGGIPLQEQRRVFERFYRSPEVERRIPGSGLGLSIAHRIMKAHGGDLTVKSQPGETTFRMTLPMKPKGDPD